MKKQFFILSGMTSILAGCIAMTPAQQRAIDQNTCVNYGFQPHTDAFAKCMMRLDLYRQQAIMSAQQDLE
ncbi:hypothetical protein AAIB41_09850 [Brucella sp. BE17]|uniref:hypothetical protein n=1 Tax=Brucella sp. BE17 TaxID=3142977 RepID=UPI0031BA00C3